MKTPVLFSGDDRLEGILEWPEGLESGEPGPAGQSPGDQAPAYEPAGDPAPVQVAGGVVVAHPHPLYGGTMAQPVVHRIAQVCRERGFASLRFNFRGVGRSGGGYSGTEEYRDVEAALAYLRGQLASRYGRALPLGLAGYSFGSVMAGLAAASGAVPVDALALIALVVDWDEVAGGMVASLARFRGPVFVLCGETDELAAPGSVERALAPLGLDLRLSIMEGTGHYFEHRQREVGERVASFFAEVLTPGRVAGQS